MYSVSARISECLVPGPNNVHIFRIRTSLSYAYTYLFAPIELIVCAIQSDKENGRCAIRAYIYLLFAFLMRVRAYPHTLIYLHLYA